MSSRLCFPEFHLLPGDLGGSSWPIAHMGSSLPRKASLTKYQIKNTSPAALYLFTLQCQRCIHSWVADRAHPTQDPYWTYEHAFTLIFAVQAFLGWGPFVFGILHSSSTLSGPKTSGSQLKIEIWTWHPGGNPSKMEAQPLSNILNPFSNYTSNLLSHILPIYVRWVVPIADYEDRSCSWTNSV